MKKKANLIYLFLSAALIVISAIILHGAQNKPVHEKKDAIDSFVDHAHYVSYNKLGQLDTKLTAPKVTHIKNKKMAYFFEPRMLTYTEDRIPWHIQATHAKSSDDMQHVFLWKNVVIHQLTHTNTLETTIKTSELTVLPQQSIAKTNAAVSIYRLGSTMHGKGLIANLKTGQYELLSHSKGIYIPEKTTH